MQNEKNRISGNHIPIFFSTDDNYIPFLDVAIRSLLANASPAYEYRIIVLHTGVREENVLKIKQNERAGVQIDFIDISNAVEQIKAQLKDAYHFSVVMYYRLFIASLFPNYDKVLYLDCDLVVLGDVSKLFNVELGGNILGAAPEQHIRSTEEFRIYAEKAVGVHPDVYVNSGVLLMNLASFRQNRIEEKFIKLISEHDFDLLDPDQAYLNYLCLGKIHILPTGWNKEATPVALEGEKNIVHYALYKKPWQYEDTTDGEYFWQYAKNSPFYEDILRKKANFGEKERAQKAETAQEILAHALQIVNSEDTFMKKLENN